MNRPNIDRLLKELGDILSEKYGAEIRFSAKPKEEKKDAHESGY